MRLCVVDVRRHEINGKFYGLADCREEENTSSENRELQEDSRARTKRQKPDGPADQCYIYV